MSKIQMDSPNKLQIALIGGSLLILISGYIVLSDLTSRAKRDLQQVRLLEARLSKMIGIFNKREKITSDYAKYQVYLSPEKMLPRQLIEELLREIERIARYAGASIVNLSPQNTPDTEHKQTEYQVDLRLECSSDQLLIFFNSVQESKFLIKVVRFSVAPRDEQGLVLKVEMLLSLSVG